MLLSCQSLGASAIFANDLITVRHAINLAANVMTMTIARVSFCYRTYDVKMGSLRKPIRILRSEEIAEDLIVFVRPSDSHIRSDLFFDLAFLYRSGQSFE